MTESQSKKQKLSLRSSEFAAQVLSSANERLDKLDVSWDTRRGFALKQYASLILSRLDLTQMSIVKLVSKQAGVSERALYDWLAHQRDFGSIVALDGRGSQSMFHGFLCDPNWKEEDRFATRAFEYGKNSEGYWTATELIEQTDRAWTSSSAIIPKAVPSWGLIRPQIIAPMLPTRWLLPT
jgi:hypothetical protein